MKELKIKKLKAKKKCWIICMWHHHCHHHSNEFVKGTTPTPFSCLVFTFLLSLPAVYLFLSLVLCGQNYSVFQFDLHTTKSVCDFWKQATDAHPFNLYLLSLFASRKHNLFPFPYQMSIKQRLFRPKVFSVSSSAKMAFAFISLLNYKCVSRYVKLRELGNVLKGSHCCVHLPLHQ